MPSNAIQNVAIIMDGNGRWAQARSRPRFWGHVRGCSRVSQIIERASDLGLESLTLYAFSSENWARPNKEIQVLLRLLGKYIIKERKRLVQNRVRFKVIGSQAGLSDDLIESIHSLEDETKNFEGLKLNIAFGYGGRQEILQAVNQFITTNPGKNIKLEDINANLYDPDIPEIDLLIRTGGDCRVSNFLLWQLAYTELYFCSKWWPEFCADEFTQILREVDTRDRRFGGVNSQVDSFEQGRMISERKLSEHKLKDHQPSGFNEPSLPKSEIVFAKGLSSLDTNDSASIDVSMV